jgi:site-specific recombinase XerD
MSPTKAAVTPLEMYDQAVKYARDQRLPPSAPTPLPTKDWLPENIAVLNRYHAWLVSGGASLHTIRLIYIIMAGHVLGLNHKPSAELDLDADLQKAMDFILAKRLSVMWTKMNRNALEKFRRFLLNERGQVESKITRYDPALHTEGLPEWLVTELERYQRIKQRNWREARLEGNIRRFWSGFLLTWRFLVEQRGVKELADLKRSMVYDYADQRLKEGHSVKGVNGHLRSLHAFLGFLADQGYSVPHSLMHLPCLKEPDSLPRFLTDAQVKLLRDDFEGRVQAAWDARGKRDALLDRAAFYLLWQCGLRVGEVEELRLEDLDLNARRLMVRKGKGQIDRGVFLTLTAVQAVQAYLAVRGMGPTDHLFLFRNQPLCKDMIPGRIRAAGKRTGVHVYPHRLRHTCATQLLNAGCRITSIQKFLGHKRINTTLTYARVHDQTVAEDYFTAMSSVEKRLDLLGKEAEKPQEVSQSEREVLLALTDQLLAPKISLDLCMEVATRMKIVLDRSKKFLDILPIKISSPDHPPPNSFIT